MKNLLTALAVTSAFLFSGFVIADDGVSAMPKIVKLSPAEGAADVPLDTTEISIEFDQPMAPTYSLFSDCDNGICYQNGFWRTKSVFVLNKVKLTPGRKYQLGIGNPKTGQQNFGANGVAIVPIYWTFTAASAQ